MADQIKVVVNSTWQGLVGIRDKHIVQCVKEKRDMLIECENSTMLIPFQELGSRSHSRSKEKFKDKFSDEWHRLYYYVWKPAMIQQTML